MFCTKCGNKCEDNASFCTKCGEKLLRATTQESANEPMKINASFATFRGFGESSTDLENIVTQPKNVEPVKENVNSQNSQTTLPPFDEKKTLDGLGETNISDISPKTNTGNPFAASSFNTHSENTPSVPNVQNINISKPSANKQVAQQPAPVNTYDLRNVEKKQAKKSQQNSVGKIFGMVLVQIVVVALIAYCGFTGKLNNSMGEINIVTTAVLLAAVMLVECLAYILFFSTKKKTKEEKLPPQQQYNRSASKPSQPIYLSDLSGGTPKFESGYKSEALSNSGSVSPNNANSDNSNANSFGGLGAGAAAMQYSSDDDNTMILSSDDDATVVMSVNAPPRIYPYLELTTENGEVVKVEVNKAEFILGRLRGRADYVIENKKVSKLHAAIIEKNSNYYIKDYGSLNKTCINNGAAIEPNIEVELKNNDTISLADSTLTFIIPE